MFKIPPAPFSRGSKTISAYASDVRGRDTVCKTVDLPLEKGAGGILQTNDHVPRPKCYPNYGSSALFVKMAVKNDPVVVNRQQWNLLLAQVYSVFT